MAVTSNVGLLTIRPSGSLADQGDDRLADQLRQNGPGGDNARQLGMQRRCSAGYNAIYATARRANRCVEVVAGFDSRALRSRKRLN